MQDELGAVVPRQLRVRGTVQLGRSRISTRLFGVLAALAVLGAALLVAGADARRLVGVLTALAVLATLLLDARAAGRPGWLLLRCWLRDRLRPRRWDWGLSQRTPVTRRTSRWPWRWVRNTEDTYD